jgi:hypothetical protein
VPTSDIRDPDSTVLRFLANNVINTGSFHGFEFGPDQQVTVYRAPGLPASR